MGTNVPPKTRVVVGEPEADQALDEALPSPVGAERRRRPGARQLRQHLGTVRGEPCCPTREKGRVRRQRQHERQPRQDRFEGRVTGVGGRHADVDVQPADALPARGDPGKADELLVARIGGDLLDAGGEIVRLFMTQPRHAIQHALHLHGVAGIFQDMKVHVD